MSITSLWQRKPTAKSEVVHLYVKEMRLAEEITGFSFNVCEYEVASSRLCNINLVDVVQLTCFPSTKKTNCPACLNALGRRDVFV